MFKQLSKKQKRTLAKVYIATSYVAYSAFMAYILDASFLTFVKTTVALPIISAFVYFNAWATAKCWIIFTEKDDEDEN